MGEKAKPIVLTSDVWHRNNRNLLQKSLDVREEWRKRKAESGRVIQERWQTTLVNQRGVTGHLADRSRQVFRWQVEVHSALEALNAETTRLQQGCGPRLRGALDTVQHVQDMARECLQLRDRRRTKDAVEDPVQRTLKDEERTTLNTQRLLEKCVEDCNNQIKRNTESRERLESDWSDKCEAYHVDSHCTLMNTGATTTLQPFATKADTSRWSSPDSWMQHTLSTLESAYRETEASRTLRTVIDETVREEATELRACADGVDRSLLARVRDYEEVLFQLRTHAKEIIQEILQAEKMIIDLKDLLLALKSGPFMLVQSRLTQRNLRPNNELCNDVAQNRLQSELAELGASQSNLERELRMMENSLCAMQDALAKVQEETRLKQESLDIDRSRCCPVRRLYPTLQKLLGY